MKKTIISDTGGMTTYLKINTLTNPAHKGWKHVKIVTTYADAKDPEAEQTRFDMCMDPTTFKTFTQSLNNE